MKKPTYDELIAALSESDHSNMRIKYGKLKVERDALAAQVELLREVTPNMLTKAHFNEAGSIIISGYVGGYSLVTSLYQAMFDAAIKGLTPAQCLDEIKAQAGRYGFIAGVNATGQGYNGELGLSDDEIIDLAELYVTRKLRQSAKAGSGE